MKFDGIATYSEKSANYQHFQTTIGKWKNTPVAVGGYPVSSVVEHFENGNWIVKDPFPFMTDRIYAYSTASINQYLFIFGK